MLLRCLDQLRFDESDDVTNDDAHGELIGSDQMAKAPVLDCLPRRRLVVDRLEFQGGAEAEEGQRFLSANVETLR